MQLFQVTRVIDGDTFEVDPPISRDFALQSPMQQYDKPGMFKKVRLANINAPEGRTPQGIRSTLYLKELIEGKRVTLKPTGVSNDRVVADVWRYPNKLFVNAMMVYSGYSSWIESL